MRPAQPASGRGPWLPLAWLLLVTALPAPAPPAPADDGRRHAQVVRERADKITAALELADTNQARRVSGVIARQYFGLAEIHAARDAALAAARAQTANSPAGEPAPEAAAGTVMAEVEARQRQLHREFLAALAAELPPEQVERVKDGMTFGVAPLTFAVYCRMFPELTEEQRGRILAWLHEAREMAMVAGTAGEKHAVFRRFKGRINNELVRAGYDLKAGERNLRPPVPSPAATNPAPP